MRRFDLNVSYRGYDADTEDMLNALCHPGQSADSGFLMPERIRDITFTFTSDEARQAAIARLREIAAQHHTRHNQDKRSFEFWNDRPMVRIAQTWKHEEMPADSPDLGGIGSVSYTHLVLKSIT